MSNKSQVKKPNSFNLKLYRYSRGTYNPILYIYCTIYAWNLYTDYVFLSYREIDLKAKSFSSVVYIVSRCIIYIIFKCVHCAVVRCDVRRRRWYVFFPSQPTPRGETGTAAHSARTYTRRRSKGIDLYI